MDPTGQAKNLTGAKRKSRFEDDPSAASHQPEAKKPNLATNSGSSIDISAAAARAAEISRELAAKIASVSSILHSQQVPPQPTLPSGLPVFSLQDFKKPAAIRPLLLDAQGREIDEHGQLVTHTQGPVKTLQANVLAERAAQKRLKENPYLAHHRPQQSLQPQSSSSITTGGFTSVAPSIGGIVPGLTSVLPPGFTPSSTVAAVTGGAEEEVLDERLPSKVQRDKRAKKAFHFVTPGTLIAEAAELRLKEERKIIAGYASGRKQLGKDETHGDDDGDRDADPASSSSPSSSSAAAKLWTIDVPPVCDSVVPVMEWWDEVFLPKQQRTLRKVSKAAQQNAEDYALLHLAHVKTHIYVQHPVAIKPLVAEKTAAELTVPVYLTKQERRKLRKATRAAREQEKRDQQLLGLLPAAEPKLKLSNFMKILGDQAVSDPSKVELRVLQQLQKRVLNHEMRNLASKLTPRERKAKVLQKLHADARRAMHVAVFRVTDLACQKYRFKVDVHAQQWLLSGIVVLCQEVPEEVRVRFGMRGGAHGQAEDETLGPYSRHNLIVVEGGAKAVRKFTKLVTKRINWTRFIPSNMHLHKNNKANAEEDAGEMVMHGDGTWNYATPNAEDEVEATGEGGDEEVQDNDAADDKEEDHDEDDAEDGEGDSSSSDDEDEDDEAKRPGGMSSAGDFESEPQVRLAARCDLLWQGLLPKRSFTGFKFSEARTCAQARKLLEGRGVQGTHYWDLVLQADRSLFQRHLSNHGDGHTSHSHANKAEESIFDADFWN